MKSYHAHIYFPPEQLDRAQKLRELAREGVGEIRVTGRAESATCFSFTGLSGHPVGPHPLPTIELHFAEPDLAAARAWLIAHRGPFPVLIHPDTGDDFRDHSQGIEWLGESLALDFGFFELVRQRPELRIHP
jgi:DOPA 4,5-dioxygenase